MGFSVRRIRYEEDEAERERKRRRRSGVITELPEDVMIEILLRLPVQSLLKFKCVCKSWRDLFISPQFIAIYNSNISRQRTKVSIYCYGDTRKRSGTKTTTTIFFRFYDVAITRTIGFYGKKVKIVGCSGGVVCLSLCRCLDVFALWNPGTAQFKRVSPLKEETFPSLFELGDVSCGFYFDLLDYSFKIVRVGFCSRRKKNSEEGTPVHVFIFNSIDKSWRKKQLFVPAYRLGGCDSFKSDVICVKRCMYWLIKVLPRGRYLDDKYILCFDMVKEMFYRIELPPCGLTHRMQITSYEESLAMFVRRTTSYNFPGYTFDVWVMKEDYGGTNHSWSKQLSCRPSVHASFAEGFMIKDDLCWVVLTTYSSKYYLCNSKTGQTIGLHTKGEHPDNFFLHRQSLASF